MSADRMPTSADYYAAWREAADELIARRSIDFKNPLDRERWRLLQQWADIYRNARFEELGMCEGR